MEGNCEVLGTTTNGHHGGCKFHLAHNRLKRAKLKGFNKNVSQVR